MKKSLIILTVLTFFSTMLKGQSSNQIFLDASTHEQTINTCEGVFYDNRANGNYAPNIDFWTTLCPTTANRRMKLEFETFAIDPSDTVFIYYGQTINDPPAEFSYGRPYFQNYDLTGKSIEPPISDQSGCLTIRLKSDATKTAEGWVARVSCVEICQDFYAEMAEEFTKYDSLGNSTVRTMGEMFDIDTIELSYRRTEVPIHDTMYTDETGRKHYFRYDTVRYRTIDICYGDSVVMRANPNFVYNDVAYHQSADNCKYYWNFGDAVQYDSLEGNPEIGHKWDRATGYDMKLSVLDLSTGGCKSKNTLTTRVRIASNPIKTVETMTDLCSGEKLTVAAGTSSTSIIKLDTAKFNQISKEIFDTRMFLPDGGNGRGGNECFESSIILSSFNSGSSLSDVRDIQDICLTMEHSNVSDLGITLICPSGKSVILKYNTLTSWKTFLGIPAGPIKIGYLYANDVSADNKYQLYDTLSNPSGLCWTYCFSNTLLNNRQGVMQGTTPNIIRNGTLTPEGTLFINEVIDSTHYYDTTQFFQTPIQNITDITTYNPYNPPPGYINAITPDYNGFETLLGCPFNGQWTLKICDNLGENNGWLCSWWIDFNTNVSVTDWDYKTTIDTIIWGGPFITQSTPSSAVVAPPVDQCGQFIYNIDLIDNFGCNWYDSSKLTVVCTPIVDLGADKSICEQGSVTLDAGNPDATAFSWEPTGDTTQSITINFEENVIGNKTFSVQVTNTNDNIYCYGQDSIHININPAPTASFTTDKYPTEGCEPFDIKFLSTSSETAKYEWNINDEYFSDKANPEFTLPVGQYDLSLKVTSPHGCTDNISYKNLITVFKLPNADFAWSPSLVTASRPTINLINRTLPDTDTNQYRWEIQTNNTNVYDIINIFGYNPEYTWTPLDGKNIAGLYNITLDAYTLNRAPSGNIYECHDTVSKVLTIVNDNVYFPTAITPNGDGINDVFEIHNLLKGQAFPDNELTIYNRYGKRIFFAQDIRNSDQFWDPNKTNSPTGTYFYRFIGRGPIRNMEFTGSVEVIRD